MNDKKCKQPKHKDIRKTSSFEHAICQNIPLILRINLCQCLLMNKNKFNKTVLLTKHNFMSTNMSMADTGIDYQVYQTRGDTDVPPLFSFNTLQSNLYAGDAFTSLEVEV